MSDDHHLSLGDVHNTIDPSVAKSPWKRIMAFFGPAYLVSVGYMDPGNWATDIAGGSQFGYKLIWVLLMSNLMALLLQSLSVRLGIVRGRDLAQCNREMYPPAINFILYILAEIAIAACDLAEVLGMAIGLNLLFGFPLLWGVLVTLCDTVLILYLQRLGMRRLEMFIIGLIIIIGGCFLVEMFFARPSLHDVALGFIPSLPGHAALYVAIGIIGATVMPHNLYLHSALVQTRKVAHTDSAMRRAIRFNALDSTIALNIAFFVNAAILILAGSVFYLSSHHQVASLQDAYKLLTPLLGNKVWASRLFAIALIAAGQSSTITGTLAGQIVMEGYLRLRINPVVRRLITRLLAIVPAVLVIVLMGDKMVDSLLIFSQVLLSMQLAFAVIPLIHFVSDKVKMNAFTIRPHVQLVAWLVAALIVVLNFKLVYDSAASWINGTTSLMVKGLIVLGELGLLALLVITVIYPYILRRRYRESHIHNDTPVNTSLLAAAKPFERVALALDFTEKDQKVVQYALQLAKEGTSFILIHVVESVSARIAGNRAQDYETVKDKEQMEEYVRIFSQRRYMATGVLGFNKRAAEIARIVKENNCDLLIIGSHGHKAMKDWLLGETINSVRHMIEVPVFIAR
ncbi:MAG: Nramp family divalent metal transporter [Taibaiella sp.]|nr:Nramp family divalent metal transporter [Taibaiella sp.]